MTKRIVTKVGDIYGFVEGSGTYYLQLVAIDPVAMNSDVVVVFKSKDGPGKDKQIRATVLFYLHTTVKQGVRDGLWKKLDNYPIVTDVSKLAFKLYRNQEFINTLSEIKKRDPDVAVEAAFDEPYWDVWVLGEDRFKSLEYEQGLKYVAERGSVQPAASIIARINGKITLSRSVWPQ